MHRSARSLAMIPALLMVLGAAGSATAAEEGGVSVQTAGCPGDGNFGYGSVCTSLSSGAVFHSKTVNGSGNTVITTRYKKTSGSSITAKLGYTYAGTTYWGSTFTQSSGTEKTKTWTRTGDVFKCRATVGIMNVSGQGNFQTPVSQYC
ncbi:hypothetical protein ABT025_10690 [Streptomyces sp. NPDC002809]|uniref:hypothetical protein n=1 Tax=Streptomyces sp. NPDC002809 TaxID=3154433 RepID=UPI0033271A65